LQLILEEIAASNNGTAAMLNIAPYGSFPVDPEFLKALTSYPAAFRQYLGPDAYPDIYVGQSHSSGGWQNLRRMASYNAYGSLKLSQNDPKDMNNGIYTRFHVPLFRRPIRPQLYQ